MRNSLHANRLAVELTEAERYQEAYYTLSDEVSALVARNELAEGEAQRLSKFNAEILGHQNPAQKIMYVDRIRRELAEMKHVCFISCQSFVSFMLTSCRQKYAMLTKEHESATALTEDLHNELGMYKSVMVPVEGKPRTNITRIMRPPLINIASSINAEPVVGSGKERQAKYTVLPDVGAGDMTIDELI